MIRILIMDCIYLLSLQESNIRFYFGYIYVCTTVKNRPGTVVRSLSTEPKVLDRHSLSVKYRGKACLGYPFLRSHSCGSLQQSALGLSLCLCLYNCLVPCTIMQCAVQSYIQHVVEKWCSPTRINILYIHFTFGFAVS